MRYKYRRSKPPGQNSTPKENEPQEKFFGRQSSPVLKKIIGLNVLILTVLIVSRVSDLAGYAAGLLILGYVGLIALRDPKTAFFIIFGVKLTYDALWNVGKSVAGVKSLQLLSLFIILIAMLCFRGKRIRGNNLKQPLLLAAFYLFWVLMATLLNQAPIKVEVLVKQASMLLGLLVGMKYIEDAKDFNLLIYFVFLSTVIPVLASFYQFIMAYFGINVLNYTMDSVREMRNAGLYYDAATNGMVCLVGLISNAYIITKMVKTRRAKLLHMIFLGITVFTVILGATRSIITISSMVLFFFMSKDIKKWAAVIPLLVLAIYFGKPAIDRVYERSTWEVKKKIVLTQMLEDSRYRQMFTGRISLWQDIWHEFTAKSWLQQTFGSGLASNAHSSYFYLLLQIGWAGMLFYVYLNANLLYRLLRVRAQDPQFRLIGILAVCLIMLLGVSTNTILYTSYQWILYMLIGGVLQILAGEGLRSRERSRNSIMLSKVSNLPQHSLLSR